MRLTLLFLLLLPLTIDKSSEDSSSLDHNRIELLDHGWAGKKDANNHFAIYHDKDSGVEFICAQHSTWNNDGGIGCFLTGRKW